MPTLTGVSEGVRVIWPEEGVIYRTIIRSSAPVADGKGRILRAYIIETGVDEEERTCFILKGTEIKSMENILDQAGLISNIMGVDMKWSVVNVNGGRTIVSYINSTVPVRPSKAFEEFGTMESPQDYPDWLS